MTGLEPANAGSTNQCRDRLATSTNHIINFTIESFLCKGVLIKVFIIKFQLVVI